MNRQMARSPYAWTALGAWNLYFLSKLLLAWMGALDIKVLPNLLLMGVLLLPLRRRWLRIVRTLVTIPAGIALYYHDTWWPPFQRLLAQPGVLDFSWSYMGELLLRLLNWELIIALALLVLGWWLLRPWLRMTTVSVVGMLVLALAALPWPAGWLRGGDAAPAMAGTAAPAVAGPATDEARNAYLEEFYLQQDALRTRFPETADGAPFDLVLLNICSLAWSDLEQVGLRQNPLFDRMDVIFDRFNSATAYSGPAAIRLLRASCGQTSHERLYDPADPQCLLMSNLERLGFRGEVAMNHDGHFDNFIAEVQGEGGLQAAPMPIDSLPLGLVAFDGSPLRRDGDVLAQWWRQRVAQSQERVALYYNSISLHDGNRIVGADGRARRADFRARTDMLIDQLGGFMDTLQASGRKVVLVIVPEHGAALHGDRMQIPGMREIPSPAITQVPVAVKLIGFNAFAAGPPRHVAEPSSYLALSELVARVHALNEEAAHDTPDWESLLRGLPVTPLVSENEGAKVMDYAGKPYLQMRGSASWTPYPEDSR